MKIYLIKRKDIVDRDEYVAHVVAANNYKEVVSLAKKESIESVKVWDSAIITIVGKSSGIEKKPYIILSEYLAG